MSSSTPDLIDVIARHDESGTIYPLHFIWSGTSYRVSDVGRRWQDDAGEHILVMLDSGQVCELLHDGTGRWSILRRPGLSFA